MPSFIMPSETVLTTIVMLPVLLLLLLVLLIVESIEGQNVEEEMNSYCCDYPAQLCQIVEIPVRGHHDLYQTQSYALT